MYAVLPYCRMSSCAHATNPLAEISCSFPLSSARLHLHSSTLPPHAPFPHLHPYPPVPFLLLRPSFNFLINFPPTHTSNFSDSPFPFHLFLDLAFPISPRSAYAPTHIMSDALINGLAGAGGGIIAQLITYPLQTVNTRQQTERDPEKKKHKALGTLAQMSQVVRHEGWTRLYGGLTPSIVGTAASQGVYYYFYQIFRNKAEAAALERKQRGVGDGSVGMLSSLLVAALSGCVNVLLTSPIWVVVTRMQTHTKKSQPIPIEPFPVEVNLAALESPFGTSHAIQEVYDEAGVLGFWNGVLPTLIMVSNPSIQFMLYETLLKKLKERRLSRGKLSSDVTALEIFLLGALAKLGATVVTYPVLVVKSRLQAKQMTGGDKSHHYKGTLDAILKMIRYEGFYGFYKGMSTKIVQSVLAAAILFMVKEELIKGSKWLLTRGAVVAKPKSR